MFAMTTEKRININFSSLIDLKAELFKKQEALKAEKLRREFGQPSAEPPKKKSVKQNAGVQERAKKDLEEKPVSQEEIDLLQQSRTVLEKKAKIYESLTDGNVPDDEVKELYLVDFQRKVLDQKKLNKHKGDEKKITSFKINADVSEENKEEINFDDTASYLSDIDDSVASANLDEEWVDYTDSLGRSRRCLRQDLPDLLELDKQLKKSNKIVPEESNSAINEESSENVSSELPEVETPAKPVHYQTVQNNEIRSHGVGYYSFATEEDERKTQLENLNQLREQTVKQRSARERLKEKRKAILKARLDKVKKRKNIEVEEDSDESISDDEFDPLKPQVQEEEEVEEEKPEIPPKIRPWDIGKIFNTQKQKYKYTQESWIEERRSERIEEFAPPTSYYKNTDSNVKSVEETSNSPELPEEVNEEESADDTVNENIGSPQSQDNSNSDIERMIAETVTYFRKQTE